MISFFYIYCQSKQFFSLFIKFHQYANLIKFSFYYQFTMNYFWFQKTFTEVFTMNYSKYTNALQLWIYFLLSLSSWTRLLYIWFVEFSMIALLNPTMNWNRKLERRSRRDILLMFFFPFSFFLSDKERENDSCFSFGCVYQENEEGNGDDNWWYTVYFLHFDNSASTSNIFSYFNLRKLMN